ncbi:hypothetical protein Tco_0267574 [Tanacetum coccineum]
MKMEILLEPTSNKLMVEHAEYDESNTYVLERFNTTAGNPVKKILLKLNLSDHRLFKDGGGGENVYRYSNRVKEESERLNELELDNLEMDEDEKYSRKLESRLYSLQDFTRVPPMFDLTCMRDAMKNLGLDSKKINPLVCMTTCISSSEETKETPMVLEMKESVEKDYKMSGTGATNCFTLSQLSDLLINKVEAVRTESDTSIGEDIEETSSENDYEMEESAEKDLKV